MAKEQELKRVDLKVNVNCCDGCRRKVLKALNMKGVLRTEVHPTADRVAVVGDVDCGHLVKRLAKVGKIAEVIVQPPPEGEKKKRDSGGGDKIGNKASPANGKGRDGGSSGNAKHDADGKCPPKGPCADATKNDAKLSDNGNGGGGAVGNGQQEGSRPGTAPIGVSEDYHVEATMCYHRAEPAMAVPMHPPYCAANCTVPPPYGVDGCYYAVPPPPPPPHCRRPPGSGHSRPGSSTRNCSMTTTPSAAT